jgi:hypothetical protein
MSKKPDPFEFRCIIHAADERGGVCSSKLLTKESIHGAVSRNCENAWNSEFKVNGRNYRAKDSLWPKTLKVERR